MSASSRGVPLFVSDHEAWTHRIVLAICARLSAALTDSNATQRRMREASAVFRKLKVCFWLAGFVVRAEAEVLLKAVRLDDLARIHLPIRIPDGFELSKRLD